MRAARLVAVQSAQGDDARQLGDVMTENMTVVRNNDKLERTLQVIAELKERWTRINVLDNSSFANRALTFVNQLWNMLALAEVMTKGALLRDESRGAHYKPEFSLPEPKTKDPREDAEWMKLWRARHQRWAKTTLARHTAKGAEISYEDIPTPVVEPEPRWYA